ncbi:BppU family phage baseplate upper protein [Bacillus mycoides]|uniref:BppU family phage baseplate upper protein n=1 Tax=Bacillus mycoides TaxID=1405 RepID=UPI001FDB02D6|nr:BppU family phage baseplate upper protein [Bacillus mycoides]CAH2465108.1 hypothetical protein ACOSJ1_EBGNOMHC_05354 [Bacillus mycoides KBAB4]
MKPQSYEINVDTLKSISHSNIEFSQNNLNISELIFNITEDEKAIPLNDTDKIIIYFKKPDKTVVFQDKEIEILDKATGKIKVLLTTQTLVRAGEVNGEISIERVENGTKKRASTYGFSFKVRSSIASNASLESTNEFQMFDQLLELGKQDIPALIASKETAEAALEEVNKNTDQIGNLSENKADKIYTDSQLLRKANQVDLDVQESRINTLVANAGNTTGNAELQDIRVDFGGNTFATAGEAVRALSANSLNKIVNYAGALKDNTNGEYTNWLVSTNGYFKSFFDVSQIKHINSLNKGVNLTSGLGQTPNTSKDFVVYIRITSNLEKISIGRILNYNSSWGGVQGGQVKIFEGYLTNKWVKIVVSQTEIDSCKANTNYQGTMNLVFDMSRLQGSGHFEFLVINTKVNPRSGLYETFAFESDYAGASGKAEYANKADRATVADTVAVLGKIPEKTILGSVGIGKHPSTINTAVITPYKILNNNIGYKLDLVVKDANYAFGWAKLTSDKVYNDLKTKTFRIVFKGDKPGKFKVRITNGSSWGSADNTVGRSYEVFIDLNASNNFIANVDIDLSHQRYVDFYSASNRQTPSLQSVNYILTCNEDSNTALGSYSLYSYSYELGQSGGSSPADGMGAKQVAEFITREMLDDVLKNVSTSEIDKIVSWGDSLTAGGGWTSRIQTLSGIPVYNGGTGGETAITISARQGADSMMVNDIIIPADTSEILLASRSNGGFNTFLGKKATPLLQGGTAHVNPCYIDGIEGTLRWTGVDYADIKGTWVWKRNATGTAVTINRPTALVTSYDKNYNDGIMIIFMGQNGGYTDTAELINLHKLMIKHSNAKHVVVLGLSSGTASERQSYETAMKLEFGRYFISLREYLSQYGLADAGITPTQADTDAMALGKTPPSLLIDTVHYNETCKTVIGNMIFKKMKELHII